MTKEYESRHKTRKNLENIVFSRFFSYVFLLQFWTNTAKLESHQMSHIIIGFTLLSLGTYISPE